MHILISLTIKRKANCTKLAIYLQATFMFLDNFVSSRILIMKIKSNYWICGRRVASKYQFTIFNASSPTPLQRSDGWRQHCRNPSSSHPFLWRRQIPTRQQILGFLICRFVHELTYLQYFVAAAAHHVQSDDLLLRPGADKLHERLLFPLGQGVVQRGELGRVDLDGFRPELSRGLAFGSNLMCKL